MSMDTLAIWILIGIAWWGVGVCFHVWWHLRDCDLTGNDLLILIGLGISGPFCVLIYFYMEYGDKVIIKNRGRKDAE